jgi:hypothetical protein
MSRSVFQISTILIYYVVIILILSLSNSHILPSFITSVHVNVSSVLLKYIFIFNQHIIIVHIYGIQCDTEIQVSDVLWSHQGN